MTESLQTEEDATPLQFGEDADRLHLEDPEARSAFNEALMEFCREVDWSPGVIAYIQDHLYERKSPNTNHSLIGVSIPMRALDFAAGNRVYTKTPRLLLKVPDKRRVEAFQGPIVHREKGTPNSALLGWGGAPLNESAVIIYPNKEGNQFNANDRPVVHWSGVRPGDIAIIGRIGVGNEYEETITGLISSVISNPPEGKSIWQHYEDTATVEDLSDILIKLREAGFSNQYSTDESYLDSTEHVSQGNASASGLFRRDKDKEICSAMFLRGDIRLGYRTQEEMDKRGFAVRAILYSAHANGSEYRPVSEAFAAEHYRYELNGAPLTADKPQTLFKDDQEIRTHEKAFDRLLDRFLEINQAIQRKYAREETPDPEDVALQSGMRGTIPQQEHGIG